jgi:ferredoxin
LIQQAWGAGTYIGDRVVDTHILNLRKKVKQCRRSRSSCSACAASVTGSTDDSRPKLDTGEAGARHGAPKVACQGEPLMTRHLRLPLTMLAVAVLLAVGVYAQKNDPAGVMLRAAIDKAQVDGDLTGASSSFR